MFSITDMNNRKPHLTLPGQLDQNSFLANYWQKKPLLMRNAIKDFTCPISAEELAGLACECNVESRIIMEEGGKYPWELRHGPFTESDFLQLAESHWTLLVQECNKYVPELADLLDLFNFIPNWRVDDVMVSYATPYGSVGPHLDQYDVFLLQAEGIRRWQINDRKYDARHFLPDCDLRILEQFEAEEDWLLSPGDILYLPPGVAHYGVAQNDCITISIGFRTANHYQLLSAYVDDAFCNEDDFFLPRISDPDLEASQSPGLIDEKSLEKITSIFKQYANNTDAIKTWFGRYITEPKNDSAQEETGSTIESTAELIQNIQAGKTMVRSEYSRFAYIQLNGNVYLYIDGQEYLLPESISFAAALLCDNRNIAASQIIDYKDNITFEEFLLEIFNKGYFYFSE